MHKLKDKILDNYESITRKVKVMLFQFQKDDSDKYKSTTKFNELILELINDTDFLDELEKNNKEHLIDKDETLKNIKGNNTKEMIKETLASDKDAIKLVGCLNYINIIRHWLEKHKEKNEANISEAKIERICKKINDKKISFDYNSLYEECKNYDLEYYNRKLFSDDFKEFVAITRSEDIYPGKYVDINICRNMIENVCLKNVEVSLRNLKKALVLECINNPEIDIAFKCEAIDIKGEMMTRAYISIQESYMYASCHIEESCLSNKKAKRYNLPEKSPSVHVILSKKEWEEYEKSILSKRDGYLEKYVKPYGKYEEMQIDNLKYKEKFKDE